MSIEVTEFSASELRKMQQGDTRLFSLDSHVQQTHISQTARRGRGKVVTELVMLTRKSFDTEKYVLVECVKPCEPKKTGVKSD